MGKKTIEIDDIPIKAFQQYQSGARFSTEITLSFTPQPGTFVLLSCQPQPEPFPTPLPIITTVKHVIYLDTVLASKQFFSLTFDL